MNQTPVSLLERLRVSPDNGAWQRLADLYLPLVQRWLNRHGLESADADDLTQEILLTIVRELPEFEHSGRAGAFRAWLRTITVHRLRAFWRRKQSSPAQVVDEELNQLEDPASEVSRMWDKEHDEFILRRLLEMIEPEFSPATWHAFQRQTVDGLTASQAAAELGVTANAVLIAKSRVLRRCARGQRSDWMMR